MSDTTNARPTSYTTAEIASIAADCGGPRDGVPWPEALDVDRLLMTVAELGRLKRLDDARVRIGLGGRATWDDMQLALEQARHEIGEMGDSRALATRALQLLGQFK